MTLIKRSLKAEATVTFPRLKLRIAYVHIKKKLKSHIPPCSSPLSHAPRTSQLQVLPWPLSPFPFWLRCRQKPFRPIPQPHSGLFEYQHFLLTHKALHAPPDGFVQGPFKALLHGCSHWSDAIPIVGKNNKKFPAHNFTAIILNLTEMP